MYLCVVKINTNIRYLNLKQFDMNLRMILLLVIGVLMAISACKPGEVEPGPVNQATDLRVPAGFNYETVDEVRFEIKITDERFGGMSHRVTIYHGNPVEDGKELVAGAASISKPFIGKIEKAIIANDLYVTKTAPNGDVTIKKAIISDDRIEMEFQHLRSNMVKSRNASVDCSSGCDEVIENGSNQNVNANGNKTVCIIGTFSGNINLNGQSTVVICGTATIGNLNMNGNNTELIITSTGEVTFSNGVNANGSIFNYNKATFNQGLTLNGSARIVNEGEVSIGQNFTINSNAESENGGTITINNNLTLNSNALLSNYCNITANQNITLNSTLNNHNYIYSGNTTTVNGNGKIDMFNGAMSSLTNLTVNGNINGQGAKSVLKITQNTTINGTGSITGNLELCDENGIETNWGSIGNNVDQSCDFFLPTDECNPEGHGESDIDDGDGDGVPDQLDDFPNLPAGAFSNFYPSENEVHSLVFEDLWPGYGDFDMNDVVVDFRHNLVTNSNNQVVEIRSTFILRALGGSLNSGFAIELPISASNVGSVTGGTLESGHSSAVVVIFENSKDHLKAWNTNPAEASLDPVVFNVIIQLANPVALSNIGLGVYNPFIWRNTDDGGRGHEIHIGGKAPTALADGSMFGVSRDDTNPAENKYYISKDNLCWAMHVPEEFNYPVEKADITQTYLRFAEWAQSGGTQSQNWYQMIPGNVNMSNIYE